MKKSLVINIILVEMCCLQILIAQTVQQKRYVFSSGGTVMQSVSFSMNHTVGQSAIGESRTNSYFAAYGFWSPLVAIPTSVRELRDELPMNYAISQNYPNPFNPTTVIRYQLPGASRVTLKIYNVLGQTIATLVNEMQDAGHKSAEWDASNTASGVYFYRLEATSTSNPTKSFMQVKKMLLLR